ncbi:MAG: GNAT family N-acetyltransferase [Flavobacterium sp.]
MAEIKLELDDRLHGAFNLYEDESKTGEMVVSVKNNILTVYHTEVAEAAAGKGYAKELLNEMTTYARVNGFKVRPLCPYVHAQFKRHPEEYNDIWLKTEDNE